MCGIVGYIGNGNVYDVLIKGLHRLEYRGYDSAGVAMVSPEGKLKIYKARGKVENLEQYCKDKDLSGCVGIAHTRWATHGEPSDLNAHPHYSDDGRLALVHNGTIENYKVLKDALTQHGCKFHSETDTEVLVQLIEYIKVKNDCSLVDAVREALKQVVGAYAIAVLEKDNPDQIISARKSSPLVITEARMNSGTYVYMIANPYLKMEHFSVPSEPPVVRLKGLLAEIANDSMDALLDEMTKASPDKIQLCFCYMMDLIGIITQKMPRSYFKSL